MENGFGVRMECAEDHYVQVESAMLGSLCYTRARYNFEVSQWFGRGHKMKTMTTTSVLGLEGDKSCGDRFM